MIAFHEVGIPVDDLLSASSDFVHVMTADGEILYANEVAAITAYPFGQGGGR